MLLDSPRKGTNYWSRSSSTLYPLTTSDKLQIDGAVTFSSTLGVTGLVTLSSGLHIVGDVGIGTTSPGFPLEINSSAANTGVRVANSSTGGAYYNVYSGGANKGILGYDGAVDVLKFNYGGTLGGVNHLIIDSTGRVGIGTVTPGDELEVNGGTTISSALAVTGLGTFSSSLTIGSTCNISSGLSVSGALSVTSSGQFSTSVGISNTLDVTGLITVSTSIRINTDSAGLQLGAGQDATIQFNGTDLKITESVTASAELDVDVTGGVYNFGLNEVTDSILKIWDSDKTDNISLTHDSTQATIATNVGNLDLKPAGYLKVHKDIHIFTSPAANRYLLVYGTDSRNCTLGPGTLTSNNLTALSFANTATGIVRIISGGYAGDSEFRVYDSGATQYIQLKHNTTDGEIYVTTGVIIINVPSTLTIGTGAAGVDYILKFDGETNDGTITFMEDEDTFRFSDDIEIPSTDAIYLGNADTDGSWRMIRSGTDLSFERRVAGVWVNKGYFIN